MTGGRQREAQVIELLLEGCSNKEIAQELGMALRTVKAHMFHLFLRHGLSSSDRHKRVQLIVKLYREQREREASGGQHQSGETRKRGAGAGS
jgi:DNA-binding NarL/FixJ family response regulator